MWQCNQIKNYTQGHLRVMIKAKHSAWLSYREIQEELGIWSLNTIHRRITRDTTTSYSSSPHNPNRKYDFQSLCMLYAIRKYQECSIDDCVDALEWHGIIFPRSSVSYYLKQRWLTTKENKRIIKKFKEYSPWYLHIDITYWPKINGIKYYIYVAIDRATRLIYIEVHSDKKAHTAREFLANATEFFPFQITKILTDNGKEFTLKNHKGKYNLIGEFDKLCDALWIEHRLTQPYTPQTNGMVEKANDTIKSNTVWIHIYEDGDQMKKDIKKFMIHYNLSRRHWWIHKEGKWRTPYDALCYYDDHENVELTVTPELFKSSLMES